MRTKFWNAADNLSGKARASAPPKAVGRMAAVIDPVTQLPIPRDLRFHHFVAHRREFYFLNGH